MTSQKSYCWFYWEKNFANKWIPKVSWHSPPSTTTAEGTSIDASRRSESWKKTMFAQQIIEEHIEKWMIEHPAPVSKEESYENPTTETKIIFEKP